MDEHNIPIDINTNKLLEWLISRRHVNKDWQDNIVKVREKINNAIQDMPAHEGIVKLLSGQHINYFHCLKIVEILKQTEADTKNLFGRYGSQRMKDWQDIIQSYQRDNIYLAEAAQMLMRNVSYEVPSLKKQILKSEQTQLECEKKIKDYTKAENTALNEFNMSCKNLGIKGAKIKKELIELLDVLPEIYEKAARTIKTVQPALEMYSAFIKFHLGRDNNSEVLPLLEYVIRNGNTTTYEYTYDEKPISIEPPQLNIVDDENEENSNEIDFGDGEDIDFGDINSDNNVDVTGTPLSEGDIDWGSLTTVEDDFEFVEHVDLDISLEESGIIVEKSGLDGGVARGNDAFTILDNPKTQDLILNDMLELEAFLKMRLYEMASDNDLLSMSQLDVPTILQIQSPETVMAMTSCVKTALNEIGNKRTQHLHNVKHSPKYVDLLTASLKQHLKVVDRMKASKEVLEAKILESREEGGKIDKVLSNIVEKTKILQKQIEEDVSKKYKGRPVSIIGGVNTL